MTGASSKTPELEARIQADPDLVDRIFEYIFADPAMAEALQIMAGRADKKLHQLKTAVRAEFRGEDCYIAGRPATARQELVSQVLALFNGRNATEVARRLGIGRTTVYRCIRQASGKPYTK